MNMKKFINKIKKNKIFGPYKISIPYVIHHFYDSIDNVYCLKK